MIRGSVSLKLENIPPATHDVYSHPGGKCLLFRSDAGKEDYQFYRSKTGNAETASLSSGVVPCSQSDISESEKTVAGIRYGFTHSVSRLDHDDHSRLLFLHILVSGHLLPRTGSNIPGTVLYNRDEAFGNHFA